MKNVIYFFIKPSLGYWLTKNLITCLTIILILLPQQSCNTTEPPNDQTLSLKLEDVSCTEAWLQLTTNNIQLPATINLLKNNSVSQIYVLNTQDSLLYIDSLLPNQNYSFQVSSIQYPVSSNKVTATTLDTTSHEFSWQSWEFGECSSSSLYDVAIIDENNIWAVGEIYMRDSLGNCDPNAYNAVHWDGTKWELKRIYHYSSCNPVDYPPFRSIIAFSDTEIVLTSGGSIGWFNGKTNRTDCGIRSLLTGAINKLWGSSSNDLYAVGNGGNIAHWDGVRWRKIESGTAFNINDIWGDYNQKSDEWEILAVCGNILHGGENEREIIRLKNNNAMKSNSEGSKWPLSGIWFKSNTKYYAVGSGIYQKNFPESRWMGEPLDITTYFVNKLRGNGINDLIAVGAYGEVLHFNGKNWKSYINQTYLNSGTYLSVATKESLIIVVGWNSKQAVILKGIR